MSVSLFENCFNLVPSKMFEFQKNKQIIFKDYENNKIFFYFIVHHKL